ncbi:hypothetical protein [Litorimonas haliclonae]|uniref:hypothetical protein n=1 Tax=Litorimonas haliclonae TaxID=2081977 RepID=UPI0039F0E2E1
MVIPLTGIGTSIVGIAALKYAWAKPGHLRPYAISGGWVLLGLALFFFARSLGGEIGVPVGATFICVTALAFALANIEVRPQKVRREREAVIDPAARKKVWWRGTLRVLLAGPLSGAAAFGVGTALSTKLPMEPVNAVAIGGLMVPLIWGAGMAWTLSDGKILRAFTVLLVVCAVSYPLAFLF